MADYRDTALGDTTDYPSHYDAGLLYPIARQRGRDELAIQSTALPFAGFDLWTAYELSWLQSNGLPQVAIAEFTVPAESPNIIESKSLKLYLNSLNQHRINDEHELKMLLERDLSAAAGASVSVDLYRLEEFAAFKPINEPHGICLDQQNIVIDSYQRNDLTIDAAAGESVTELLYSHLLRTNCPVTDQPDWATLYIAYSGPKIDRESLLRYLVSYRSHQDFHEQCVEAITLDLLKYCQPQQLTVTARYTRRGGIDINPQRSVGSAIQHNYRQVRQ
ncbi:MAG: NADPH-dependent 7-cyano-7-deazaguanine reductase QueF [Porticoccaceae bacterium]